jgi:hypothetical protein
MHATTSVDRAFTGSEMIEQWANSPLTVLRKWSPAKHRINQPKSGKRVPFVLSGRTGKWIGPG